MDPAVLSSVVHLSDEALVARVKHLAAREREATGAPIAPPPSPPPPPRREPGGPPRRGSPQEQAAGRENRRAVAPPPAGPGLGPQTPPSTGHRGIGGGPERSRGEPRPSRPPRFDWLPRPGWPRSGPAP